MELYSINAVYLVPAGPAARNPSVHSSIHPFIASPRTCADIRLALHDGWKIKRYATHMRTGNGDPGCQDDWGGGFCAAGEWGERSWILGDTRDRTEKYLDYH